MYNVKLKLQSVKVSLPSGEINMALVKQNVLQIRIQQQHLHELHIKLGHASSGSVRTRMIRARYDARVALFQFIGDIHEVVSAQSVRGAASLPMKSFTGNSAITEFKSCLVGSLNRAIQQSCRIQKRHGKALEV